VSRDEVFDLLNDMIEKQSDISLDQLIDFTYQNCSDCSTNNIRDLFSRVNHKMGKKYNIDEAIRLWVKLKD